MGGREVQEVYVTPILPADASLVLRSMEFRGVEGGGVSILQYRPCGLRLPTFSPKDESYYVSKSLSPPVWGGPRPLHTRSASSNCGCTGGRGEVRRLLRGPHAREPPSVRRRPHPGPDRLHYDHTRSGGGEGRDCPDSLLFNCEESSSGPDPPCGPLWHAVTRRGLLG